jgi:hypothetical protein
LETARPFEKERIYRSLALSWIRENPWRLLALIPQKLNNAFGLFLRAQVFDGSYPLARVVHLLSYGLIAPFALGGMIAALRRWRACSLLYIVVLSYLPSLCSLPTITLLAPVGYPDWVARLTTLPNHCCRHPNHSQGRNASIRESAHIIVRNREVPPTVANHG